MLTQTHTRACKFKFFLTLNLKRNSKYIKKWPHAVVCVALLAVTVVVEEEFIIFVSLISVTCKKI